MDAASTNEHSYIILTNGEMRLLIVRVFAGWSGAVVRRRPQQCPRGDADCVKVEGFSGERDAKVGIRETNGSDSKALCGLQRALSFPVRLLKQLGYIGCSVEQHPLHHRYTTRLSK